MGWELKWAPSFGNDSDQDYHVSFTPEQMEKGDVYYNHRINKFPSEEAPRISIFYRDKNEDIFHTYSCYSRALHIMNGACHYLDLVPKGRDPAGLSYSMEWQYRHATVFPIKLGMIS